MKIYLTRHGECPANLSRVYNLKDEDLNETGVNQAYALRKKLEDYDYDIVISSPLIRAKHTAEIINVKNKEIIYDDRIAEREHGNLQGRSIDTVDRDKYWDYYATEKIGTEESIEDLCKRVFSFLDELKEKQYEKVLIVAHSGVSKAFYVYFNGVPTDGKLLDLGLKNTELKEYNL